MGSKPARAGLADDSERLGCSPRRRASLDRIAAQTRKTYLWRLLPTSAGGLLHIGVPACWDANADGLANAEIARRGLVWSITWVAPPAW
jgi:hypothetical protein